MEEFENPGDVLQDVTNIMDPSTAEEEAEEARKAGLTRWNDRTPFNYENRGNESSADWAAGAARYEWEGEFGDVGPAIPELEKQLFELEYHSSAGVHFDE